jgi:aminoglycoside phosphotransferase (APT) family kinase protein
VESRTKNRKPREQIAQMAARAFGGTALASGEDAVRELKDGWFNVVYDVRLADGREVILKIAPPPGAEVMTYERDLMRTEVEAMRRVAENPVIPVPRIHFHDAARDLCDADYFFMEKLRGDNLGHVKSSLSPETRARVETRIGEILRAINGFTGTYFGYPGHPDLRGGSWRAAFAKIVDSVLEDGGRKHAEYDADRVRAAVLKHAPALDAVGEPRLVHWDAWDPNFFVLNGEVTGLVDFERALWADPLMEAQFRPLYGEGIPNVLRGYGRSPLGPDEEPRSQLYTLHLALVMYTECYYRSYDTDFVFDLSKAVLASTLEWLESHAPA